MEVWARSLFDAGDRVEVGDGPAPGEAGGGPGGRPTSVPVGEGAWLAHRPGLVRRHDLLLEALVDVVPWRHERRPMYERQVDVPRLVAAYGVDGDLPHPALGALRDRIDGWFGREASGPVTSVGLCWYRDGRDSVAWHGDRIGRSVADDTLVAVVSIGARRRFLLRPASGGPTLRYDLGEGDLLVMGGTCQRTWRHCVPKTGRAVGPRISIQFRSAAAVG